MFVPPQFRENEDPPTSRAVLSKKEDGSVELSFPDLPSAEPIKIAEPTMLAIRERPKPNPKPASTTEGPAIEGSASKTPAHGKNSKKRAATKSPDMGVFELGMHDAKREDNGTHEDKTVSMDKYWKGKAAEMNIDPEDMEIPQVSLLNIFVFLSSDGFRLIYLLSVYQLLLSFHLIIIY